MSNANLTTINPNNYTVDISKYTLVGSVSEDTAKKIYSKVDNIQKRIIAYGNSYVAVLKALVEFDDTGYYKYIINPNTGEAFTDTKEFGEYYFDMKRTAITEGMKVYRRWFNNKEVVENGKVKKINSTIGGVDVADFPKTSLVLLSSLKDDELEKIEGNIRPDMKMSEIKAEMDKVHIKKAKNGSDKPKDKKHPCNDMDLEGFLKYITDAVDGFAKSKAYKDVLTGGKEGSKMRFMKIWSNTTEAVKTLYSEALETEVFEAHNEPTEAVKEALNK